MKQLTMVEYVNDGGQWVWFNIHSQLNEREAIKAYCKEMGLTCGKIKQEMDGFYSELQDVRAFKININK